ncbi:MAG TPA: tetratricopeptide repeat protein, partial [Minicystis sp.]|nr:tetratricopeptide repeat protein [Minicystis sp.]
MVARRFGALAAAALFAAFAAAPARAEGASWATEHAAELTQLGRAQAAQGDVPAAVRRYLDALASDPTYAPAYLALGKLYESVGEVKEAERTYAMGIEHVLGFAEARLARARLFTVERRMPEAIVDLEAAAAQRPNDAAVLEELSRAYVAVRAMPAALAVTRRLAILAAARGDAPGVSAARVRARAL